jgi:ectoine hydroxylase-related dioxygenase (phytanoyl-CoA dioxygenase family)
VQDTVLPIVEGVLDAGCLVSSLSSIAIAPGEAAQLIHADDQLIPLPRPHVPIVCNTMWAITDFTAENGATRLAPGTHTRDRAPVLGEDVPSIAAEMTRGSVLVYNGSLWHGGGANLTGARRLGVAMNYCRPARWHRTTPRGGSHFPSLALARSGDRIRVSASSGRSCLVAISPRQAPEPRARSRQV